MTDKPTPLSLSERETLQARIGELEAEKAALLDKSARLLIAYHVAICSPKGIIPMDEFYDADIAARVESEISIARTALTTGGDNG